jgi:ketosteroid isomerase-like protein
MSMKRLPVAAEDRRSVADWYDRWSGHVAAVDFEPVRAMFTEDAIAFGTKVEVMDSQAQLEREQWRSVWPSIEDFRFNTSTLEVIVSPDRLMATGALIFRSTGLHADGKKFERNGRSTVTLMRASVRAPWICTHSHISLKPGTPAISHGRRPEKA